jgi:PKHD-type hydroxylase
MIVIPAVIDASQVEHCRDRLARAEWQDGRNSAGYLSQAAKNNRQLADTDPTARELGDMILSELERNALFTAAALPLKVLPPLFNRYSDEQSYAGHVDGAIRPIAGTHHRLRTDLSATLFLSDPDSYDGGELVVKQNFEERATKLPAGHLALYPGTSVHRVTPVTRGERLAAFFWIQSMVRDNMQRAVLFDLDSAIQSLARDDRRHASLVEFAGVYHNLLRLWADA